MMTIYEIRGVCRQHRAEYGERAEQMMVNDRLYVQELEELAENVEQGVSGLLLWLGIIRENVLPKLTDEVERKQYEHMCDLVLKDAKERLGML